jgi:FMN phosphatase YigB (HAD superfamily)
MDFPLLEANLVLPEQGATGKLAIVTNDLAPSMVATEVKEDLLSDLFAIGRVVVNRDGMERVIINSLANSNIQYILLFGEESLSFKPSTNLLSALMHGYSERRGNFIVGGKGVAHCYPSVSLEVLEGFKQRVHVLPLFRHKGSKEVILEYMKWIQGKIPNEIYDFVLALQSKKIYFDSLNYLIELLSKYPTEHREPFIIPKRELERLKPPVFVLEPSQRVFSVPFKIYIKDKNIVVDIDVKDRYISIQGNDSWQIAYSLMNFLDDNRFELTPEVELLLGVELSRVEMQFKTGLPSSSIVHPQVKESQREEVPLLKTVSLIADKKFYYRIGVKNQKVFVQSLTHDPDVSPEELQSVSIVSLVEALSQRNRFEDYSQSFLHRVDVGIEVGRAAIALEYKREYLQDFRNLFALNTNKFPLFLVEGSSFLEVHKGIVRELYIDGLTMRHPDAHKGTMRSGCVLATYRRSKEALCTMPEVYRSGDLTTTQMREQYKQQLLSPDNEGSYTYGSRTRRHFGVDQLEKAIDELKKNPNKPFVVQRFDFNVDMTITETPVLDDLGNTIRTRIKASKDPCLTHDIFFIQNKKLHSLHIARAHNIVNAYPENIFGLFDAYDSYVADELGIELGDMHMLSSRGNILLLTEEQKTKKIIAQVDEPVKELDKSSGPLRLTSSFEQGVGYHSCPLEFNESKPIHPCLDRVESFKGENIVLKAAQYLNVKGKGHNNPIVGSIDPRETFSSRELVFFQCNQRGGKLQATAVFLGSKLKEDVNFCNYLATQYSKEMNLPLGDLFLFSIGCEEVKEVKEKEETQTIQHVGFDLDQTLYPKSPKIDEAIQEYIYTKIARIKSCSIEEARDLFYYYYPKISGRKALLALGIDNAADIIQEALERADISEFLQPNMQVVAMIRKTKEKYKSVSLITGSTKSQALSKLRKLDIPISLFDHIITGEISKSDGTAFDVWVTACKKVDPSAKVSSFVYIGDRKSTDIDLPLALGMQAVLVNVKEIKDSIKVQQYKSVLGITSFLGLE